MDTKFDFGPELERTKENALKLAEKWSEKYDLERIHDQSWRARVAIILENQHLFNEQTEVSDWFAKLSMSLIPYIYFHIPLNKMVSIQPILHPEDEIFCLGFSESSGEIRLEIQKSPVSCKTIRYKKTTFKEGDDVDVKEVGQALANELTREVATDLRNNAGTYARFDWEPVGKDKTLREQHEQLYIKLLEISSIIHRKTLRGAANWIYTSPKISDIFLSACTRCFMPPPVYADDGIYYEGTISNRWKHFRDTLCPDNEILMGYRGDSYMDAGYMYCPYIPLEHAPKIGEEEVIIRRRAKKLLVGGLKFYARITINNFDDI